jgi:hypothetical protein
MTLRALRQDPGRAAESPAETRTYGGGAIEVLDQRGIADRFLDALGIHAIRKVENGGSARVVLTAPLLRPDSEPTLRDAARRSSPFTGPITGSTARRL